MRIAVDSIRRRIIVRAPDFVDRRAMQELIPAIASAVREAKGSAESFDCLIIAAYNGPVAKEASGDHLELLEILRKNGLRRSAQVGFTTLARMQLQRLTNHDQNYAYFSTEEDAEKWLSS